MNASSFARLVLGLVLAAGLASSTLSAAPANASQGCDMPALGSTDEVRHGGGLNSCGCHFNRKTGVCHCHRAPACGC